MPSYKLSYFAGRGRGETARVLFSLAGVEFENDLHDFAALADAARFPTYASPVLQIDGETFVDSMAINHYLARAFGFAGKDNKEQMLIEGYMGTIDDIFIVLWPVVLWEKDPEKKKEGFERVKATAAKKIPYVLSGIRRSGGPFLTGKNVTVADIYLAEFVRTIQAFLPEVYETGVDLEKFNEAFVTLDKIKAHRAKYVYEGADCFLW